MLNDLKRYSVRSLNNSIKSSQRFAAFNSSNQGVLYTSKCFYSSNLPEHSLIRLPALSPTMEHGTLARWAKKEGDQITEGDLIAEVETDKATMGLESTEEGYIAKILVPEKSKDIPLKTLLCVVVRDKKDLDAFKDFKEDGVPKAAPQAEPTPAPSPSLPAAQAPPATTTPPPPPPPQPQAEAAAPHQAGDRIFTSPLAKKIAAERNIDLALVKGTGPEGQIRADDVINFIATAAPKAAAAPAAQVGATPATKRPAAGAQYVDTPLTSVRSVIAKRLLQSKQTIPHYYLSVDVDLENAMKIRKELNDVLAKDKIKISVTDIIIKASAFACKRVPEVNSAWMDTFIRQYSNVDVSVAVATDNGLITPIIFNADKKGLQTINSDLGNLAQKARTGKLQPNEFQGGTFTISNLGMYGIKNFAAVINPPQACILAVGGADKRVVPTENGGHKVATYMSVTLSCDHRVVDGAVGAKWLEYFKKAMENPSSMLL